MAKPFKVLADKMPKESRERAEQKANELIREVRLSNLRQLLNLTQTDVAGRMGISQSAISLMESGARGTAVSTLAQYVASTGGTLEILAHYPEGDFKIQIDGSA